MGQSSALAVRGAAIITAGAAVMALAPAPAQAATTWDVVWDQESSPYAYAYGYAYKAKGCQGAKVKLDTSHLTTDNMLSIKSPDYTNVQYGRPTQDFNLTHDTCWNLRGNNELIIWVGYDPAR